MAATSGWRLCGICKKHRPGCNSFAPRSRANILFSIRKCRKSSQKSQEKCWSPSCNPVVDIWGWRVRSKEVPRELLLQEYRGLSQEQLELVVMYPVAGIE